MGHSEARANLTTKGSKQSDRSFRSRDDDVMRVFILVARSFLSPVIGLVGQYPSIESATLAAALQIN